jgi:hypothetical protein
MANHDTTEALLSQPPSATPSSEEGRLLACYGEELEGEDLSDQGKRELLLALWTIMQSFVDLGFNVGPGEKFTPGSDLGMDDLLNSLLLDDTAHETVALRTDDNKE